MNIQGAPAEVKGRYENIRRKLHLVLIVFFLVMPWLQYNAKPLVLFNIFERHFIIFGVSFYSHEAPLFFFFLILILLAVFIVTAVFGRLWCGWACPQTVFLHSVYFYIEKLVLGGFAERQNFYKKEIKSIAEHFKTVLLYFIFAVVSFLIAHSFAAYFLGAETILKYIAQGPSEHLITFFVLLASTSALFFNFVFFKEKLCIYVCPYGRFQNALIDRHTLVVYYDEIRGEPRQNLKNKSPEGGDCVDCLRCVHVCPVKIDIRKGFNIDCISCAKCMDACDDVMDKVGRNRKLIRFENLSLKKASFLRFRIVLYGALFVLFSGAFAWSLILRKPVDFSLSRAATAGLVSLRTEGRDLFYQNKFLVHLKNHTNEAIQFDIRLSQINEAQGYHLLGPVRDVIIEPQQDLKIPIIVEISQTHSQMQSLSNKIDFMFVSAQATQIRQMSFIRGAP